MSSNSLNILSIARRAGKIVMGMDITVENIKAGLCSCVCIASDLSEKSKKEILFVCEKENVAVFDAGVSMDEIKNVLSKRSGIVAVLDKGFAKKLESILTKVSNP